MPDVSAIPVFEPALARIAARAPRVHCLTNTVAQAYTAHALVALGAEPAMSTHPRDVLPMARQSDAVLINLGMPDPQREAAVLALADALPTLTCPIVIDPVMVHRSPFRLELFERFAAYPRLIIKGNAAEMAFLGARLPPGATQLFTGAEDRIEAGGQTRLVGGGHPLMARFSGSGCMAGAVVAAFAAVEPDAAKAAHAAMALLRAAAEDAAARAMGPGTFMAHLLDCLAGFADSAAEKVLPATESHP